MAGDPTAGAATELPFPDELFYGYLQLARQPGWRMTLRERTRSSRLGGLAQGLIHRVLALAPELADHRGLGPALLGAHDVIVTPIEPVLMMLALGLRDGPPASGGGGGGAPSLVLILMGCEKRICRSWVPAATRRVLRWLFDRLAAIVVLGEGERDFLVAERLAPADRIHVIPFGVDARFWRPAGPGERGGDDGSILAIGNDDGRDWPTLLAAAGDRPLRLHTLLPVPRPLGANVTLTRGDWSGGGGLSDADVRELYRTSRLVVVPLKDCSQPQGQSVALQAMACGRAVVLTATRGLWTPHLMVHARNCWLVPPGDRKELASAIDRLWTDRDLREGIGEQARITVERHFTSDRMARDLATLIRAVARPAPAPQAPASAAG
jgi:glycosyltransferase involved in cell wall biosynthesis